MLQHALLIPLSGVFHYLLAALAGLGSWVYLHRHTVRGDHAAAFYLLTTSCLSLFLRWLYASGRSALIETATLVSIYALFLISSTILYRLSPWHPLASYPGPLLARLSSLYLTAISGTGRRHVIIDKLHAKYGTYVRVGPNALSINSHAAIPLYNSLEKGESYRFPNHDDIASIFLKQDSREGHRERRRIWGGFFSPSSMSHFDPLVKERTWELFNCIERQQAAGDGFIDVAEVFYMWAYDLGGDMIFSGSNEINLMRDGDAKKIVETGKNSTAMMDTFGHSPWLLHILWHIPASKSAHEYVRMTATMAHNRVNAQSDAPTSTDLVTLLLEGGVPMADLERDAMIGVLAASENTTITLALACYFLAAEPKYFKQLRDQLDEAFPDPLGALSHNTLAGISLLDGILNESLRIGSLFFLPRITPPEGVEVDGRHIPGDTIIALAAYTMQMSPDNFSPEPTSFRPERWQPGGLGPNTVTNRMALASFSYGQHSCMGKALAYQQMRYVLARLVLAFDMEFRADFDVKTFREGILGMGTPHFETPLFMRFIPREGVELEEVGTKA
ncbi:cytochrome P450 [Lenzites betulinus]|nr:cytochrome P450 [Lenzites betulinus]